MSTQVERKVVYEDEKNVIFYESTGSFVKLVHVKYPLTSAYSNRVERIIEVKDDIIRLRRVHYSWDGDGEMMNVSVKDPALAIEIKQKMEQVRNPNDFEELFEHIEEKREQKEETLVDEILSKVDELAAMIAEDYNEILNPHNSVTDTQGLDQYIDSFIKEIVKRLRKAGYALPDECGGCELFKDDEEDP